MRFTLFQCLILVSLSGTPVAADNPARHEDSGPHAISTRAQDDISHEIDELLLLQDRSAQGDGSAMAAQKALLLSIGQKLKTLPESPSTQIASQIAAYVLSGGDPDVAEKLSTAEGMKYGDRMVLAGSAHFMRGEREAAAGTLPKINATELPSRIAGRVALAQALLGDEQTRQNRLALALSAMPGTLVEESALRRSALAFGEKRDEGAFWRRLDRYSRRFRDSVYADSFWNDALGVIVAWTASGHGPDLLRLDVILSQLPIAQRRRLYLVLARQSAVAGSDSLAGFAGRRLRRLAAQGSSEEQLGSFYSSLYEIVSADGDSALLRLRSFNRASLGSLERALLDAGLALGDEIERPAPTITAEADQGEVERSVLETRGSELLSQSNKLLAEFN